jgi:ATP-dependent DNA ligase
LRAFDVLVEGGEDLRKLPLSMRKANLERLLARRPEGKLLTLDQRVSGSSSGSPNTQSSETCN